MKSIVRKIALALTTMLAFIGISRSKTIDAQKLKAPRENRQRVVVLDEYEQSAFHSN